MSQTCRSRQKRREDIIPTIDAVYEMTYQFEQPFILDHRKFVAAFGDLSTPIKGVIPETVAWYRANPQRQ